MNGKKLSEQELIDWIRLARSNNIGIVTFDLILKLYGSVQNALEKLPHTLDKIGKSSKKKIEIISESEAIKELELTHEYGARIIASCEDDYPTNLAKHEYVPPIISVMGNVELAKKHRIVGIVGARNASMNSCNFVYKLSSDLVENDCVIVSGLAKGIDRKAHLGSIPAGKSIGVVAGCINNVYPKDNKDLYEAMKEECLIISQFPFDSTPQVAHFPIRNRVIAGCCIALVVVEATTKSGSLITAGYARELGKDLFVAPGSPLDPRCKGSNGLLKKQGVHLLDSADDILHVIADSDSDDMLHSDDEQPKFRYDYSSVDVKSLEEIKQVILSKLNYTPININCLLEDMEINSGLVLNALLELELANLIERDYQDGVSLLYSGE